MDMFLPYAGPAARKAILDSMPSDSESDDDGSPSLSALSSRSAGTADSEGGDSAASGRPVGKGAKRRRAAAAAPVAAKRAAPRAAPPVALGKSRTRGGRVRTRTGRPVSAPRKLSL
jgi:hypothetical protein